jgi:spore maturation protein CgeB
VKILVLLEDYHFYYTNEASKHFKNKKDASYKDTLNFLLSSKHYQSDSLANAFKAIGHKARIAIPESNPLQLRWSKENKKLLYIFWIITRPIRSIRARFGKNPRIVHNSFQFKILKAQIKEYRPDLVYFYSNIYVKKKQLLELKKYGCLNYLQWSCPIWKEQPDFPYHVFDKIISAAYQIKEYFEERGLKVKYVQQAFDDAIIPSLGSIDLPKKDLIFIGSFSLGHDYRFQVLEYLLQNGINLDIYGLGRENLPEESMVYKLMNEPLYGIEMYNMYRRYKMAIHIHGTGNKSDGINWSRYSGAKRLFEITGVGTMLITSDQENVVDLFEPDREVVTFKNQEDLLNKLKELLSDPKRIEEIARRGQAKTLKLHTFKQRAMEILDSPPVLTK